ncbi:hypothetical protein DEDE109153_11590 [Deinococcus deserti]|uniref:Uncharacterized protein n=1 Tax=Deinococcus deserti (strain DSM 17065 / CIP 109153 / LMG 22923 / VCD115) TaxID=546414 RepID=C1CXX2_DEIDV|nr:hypothetical protein [Deinococcus deserti]ACO46928.2 hypothetical protein Deide_19320 [Deinococcus deserti VCD115]
MMRLLVALAILALLVFLWPRIQRWGRQTFRRSDSAPPRSQETGSLPSNRPSGVRVVPAAPREEPAAAPRTTPVPVATPVAPKPPVTPAPVPVMAAPLAAASAVAIAAPLGTAALDDPDAIRPEVSADLLASARASVQPEVPDEVLSDALLDVTPAQLQQLFASVPTDVMAHAIGRTDDVSTAPVQAQDLEQLQGMGNAVDELDIWSFGND